MKKEDEKSESCRTPRTEARMAPLLYSWNLSFKKSETMKIFGLKPG